MEIQETHQIAHALIDRSGANALYGITKVAVAGDEPSNLDEVAFWLQIRSAIIDELDHVGSGLEGMTGP